MYTAYYFPFENCRDGIIPRLPLFDPKNGYFLKDAVLKTSANKAGKFTFTIPVDDERVLQVLQCWVTVVSDNGGGSNIHNKKHGRHKRNYKGHL